MTRLEVIAWRWTYGAYKSADFSSKQAAIDDMVATLPQDYGVDAKFAENFVYSVCIPIPEDWR